MGTVLRLKAPLAARLDLTGILPETLAGREPAEIAALPLAYGGRRVALGELFDVGETEGERLVFAEGDPRLDHVGDGLAAGEILVEGEVGTQAGARMRGGRLAIAGDAGSLAGAGLRGGRIEIGGSAGERVGGAPSGARRGMEGGVIAIAGDAGARAGERLRGGLLLIAGDAGEGLATDMIAGTISVGGAIGSGAGRGMKRGTVLVRQLPLLAEGFVDTGSHDLVMLRLLARRVPDLAEPIGGARQARRLVGDRLQGGHGEFLLLEPAGSAPS